ncbi:MAG: diguanylate cyclase [Pirellulales bacterium]|nr:diguanylate cyclase [Pirellulales bacterium]
MSGSAPLVSDLALASDSTLPLSTSSAAGLPHPSGDGRDGSAEATAPLSRRIAIFNRSASETVTAAQRLFDSLRDKDPATATHSLRTTLGCSQWSHELELPPDERDALQLAALLHDVGKIVVPRRVLEKPAALTEEEAALVARCRRVGWDVVRHKIANPQVLEIASQAGAWFDGSRGARAPAGRDLPLGSRVLAIVDAFDAMTSNQAYRPALSRDQACDELLRCAGTQFDPELVRHFIDHRAFDPQLIREAVDERRLSRLNEWLLPDGLCRDAPQFDAAAVAPAPSAPRDVLDLQLFQSSLFEFLRDAVIFVDCQLWIAYWSPGAVRLTGLSAAQAQQLRWRPALLDLRDNRGTRLREDDCPVRSVLSTGKPWQRRLLARGPAGRRLAVDVQVAQVTGAGGDPQGVTIILRDLSPEEQLRDHCQTLQRQVTVDALTGVANRAEFDRAHERCLEQHQAVATPYSLILCDIDHFKSINDNHGHPAGDEVLRRFARLLESQCRDTDLIARYGGEEFAILCPDCALPAARARAENIRQLVARTEHTVLGDRAATASFGVTSLADGESATQMLERADRALYDAKRGGRNCVVAVYPPGVAPSDDDAQQGPVDGPPIEQVLVEQQLVTPVPLTLAVDKLRGFVTDVDAEVLSIDDPWVCLRIHGARVSFLRRQSDRRLCCLMHVKFDDRNVAECDDSLQRVKSGGRTRIHVVVAAQRMRDRQRQALGWFAQELLSGFRQYLMAEEAPSE